MSAANINIESEIGPLKTILLHRPGIELNHLTPALLKDMLFEDIPYLKSMIQEHDQFANLLRENGVDVLYYQDLLLQSIQSEEHKKNIINELLALEGLHYKPLQRDLRKALMDMDSDTFAQTMIGGLKKTNLHMYSEHKPLSYFIKEDFPFYINPLPNLYFVRDPGVIIGDHALICSMNTPVRKRESLLLQFILKNHRDFKLSEKRIFNDYRDVHSIEGGDILVLSDSVLAIGCSDRSRPEAIEKVADHFLKSQNKLKEILVIQIPFSRAYMHLDTVFTMVDREAFTIYPGIEDGLKVFRILPVKNGLDIKSVYNLKTALKESLKLSGVQFIYSGGGDPVTASREQWNDSTNTLAIEPGKVIAYDRNTASNKALRKAGIEVLEIQGSELVRGRGGPRCMSMPLLREKVQ